MSMKRALFLMAVAVSLFVGDSARASYNYTTSLSVLSVTNGGTFNNTTTGATASLGGTTLILDNVARNALFVPGFNTVNIGDVSVTTTTVAPNSNTFTVNYQDVFTLTNFPAGGTGPGTNATQTLTVTGRLILAGVNTGDGTVFNIYNPPTSGGFVLGGVAFVGAADNFGNPTINGASGNLGGSILATAVPEPASFVMLGLGVGGIGLLGFRKVRAPA